MTLTFLLPHVRLSGGVKAILEYANRLAERGHCVHLVVPAEGNKWYRWDKKIRSLGKKVQTLPAETVDWFDNRLPVHYLPFNDPGLVPAADVLVATAWQTAAFAARLPENRGRKFYFIQHFERLWTRDPVAAEKTYRLPFRKIVISTWLRDILRDRYGQDAEVLVTPVNREEFNCEDKIWNRPPRVCLLHHDYDWKGYADGLRALQEVRTRNVPVRPVVFGEKLKDPKPLFDQAGWEFEYHYRPTGKTLNEVYTSCDIYLCPSWYEGLGMPAMEAMACRCALVTTDNGGCRDYAIDGQTALVSPPKAPQALAANLVRLLEDPGLRQAISQKGWEQIQTFDWEDNCRRLMRLFENEPPRE